MGLKEDEKFRAVTKENERFTRFVDVFDGKIRDSDCVFNTAWIVTRLCKSSEEIQFCL